ncbi:hypothetical protein ACH429_03700 [Streptomyces pathocidini]|uniref:Secreted protein n=1 Tax=Streptomyces pathocidini TaxID=1650571 RepID=A0ABW7UKP6_9ACTN|nr:hypothetical protein [Streptomyces pathocidini]
MRTTYFRQAAMGVAALVMTLSACGGGSGTADSAPSDDSNQATRDYARCMRENGVEMPDDGTIKMEDSQASDAAQDCSRILDKAGLLPKKDPEQTKKMLKLAQCLRKQGLDVADPDPETGTLNFPQGGPGQAQAFEKCGARTSQGNQ